MQSAPQTGFLRWWGQQLRDVGRMILPTGTAGRQPRLVLAVCGETGRWLVDGERGITPFGDGTAFTLAELETTAEAARALGMPIGLRAPIEECLVRNLDLPTAAAGRFAEILRLDLERATPFRTADVFTAYDLPEGVALGPTTRVRQLVLKRERVAPWFARLEALGLAPSTLDCFDETSEASLAVDFLDAETVSAPASGGTMRMVLALLCLVLAAGSFWIWHARQAEAIAALQQATTIAQAKAVAAQRRLDGASGTLDDLAALRGLTTGALTVTELIETLTALLPDAVVLQDLRIEGDVIEMSGQAQAAAGLLTILERSSRFTASELTAPVIREPGSNRERFTMRTRVKKDGAVPTGVRP